MARPAKVWYRSDIGWWMITLGGEKTRLVQGPNDDRHRELAEEKYVEIRKLRRTTPEAVTARTADVIESFLHHSRVHYAPDTHRINKYYCQLFAEACGQVPARDIKPFHLSRWIDPKVSASEWGETTVYNARKAALRVFTWAAGEKLLPDNPLEGLKNPKPRPRQRAITDAEFGQLYGNAGGPVQDLLLTLYLTGARPKELRDLKWESVKDNRLVLHEHKTARKSGKPRVIFLTGPLRELIERLRGNGHTYMFLNTVGKPWTMSALRQQVWRIKKKLGLPDDVCAYLCRHGFGTRAILSGVDGPTLAELMDHSSQDMISKVYVHLADQHQHLKDAAEKVSGAFAPAPATTATGRTRRRARPVNPRKPGPKPVPPGATT